MPAAARARPLVRPVPRILIGASVGAAAIALLLAVGALVDRSTLLFDRTIILGLRQWHGPAWLPDLAIEITALGSVPVLTLMVVVAVGLLAIERHWLTAAATVAATLSGSAAITLVKGEVGRPRPDLVEHLVHVTNQSFPSGHAAGSALVYLTLAGLGGQVTRDRRARRYLMAVAILLVGAIGISRVYLGVHWPSDVLAGWSFGTLWALGWWYATAWTRANVERR